MTNKRINEIAEFIKTGKTPPTAETKYFNGDVNWYTPGDLDKSKLLGSSIRKLSNLAIEENKAVVFPPNTLLIGCIGDIGKLGITTDSCSSNQQITGIYPVEDVDVNYLYYWFVGNKQILENFANNAVVPILNNKILSSVQIPLPPLPTQQKIAAILDAADAFRQKTKNIIEKYEMLAQSLFLEMFGDPVRNEKGWEKVTIGESCYFIKDGPHVSPKYVENGVPFISVNNIIKGYWDLDNVRQISEEDHQIFKKRCNPEKGDILYTKGGTTGYAKLIDIDLVFSNWVHLAVLKFDKLKLNGKFFEYMLNSKYCYSQSQIATRGIANRDLVLGQMKTITHLLPPLPLQTLFADRIALIETQKQQAQASLAKAEALFNSLLQRAFKGELVS